MTLAECIARLRTLAYLALALACAGCSTVLCEQPAGETPVKPMGFLAGTWVPASSLGGDAFRYVRSVNLRIQDAEAGLLEVAWLEQRGDELAIRKELLYLRSAGPWLFASVPYAFFFPPEQPPSTPKPLYAWARVEIISAAELVISAPNAPAFEDFFAYKLPDKRRPWSGEEDKSQVKGNYGVFVLRSVNLELLARLRPDAGVWWAPVIFHKIPGADDAPAKGAKPSVDAKGAPSKGPPRTSK